jgi:hypothetical protein
MNSTPANYDQMPGWLRAGQTCQSIRQAQEQFAQDQILAQAEVGKPAVRRADRKPSQPRQNGRSRAKSTTRGHPGGSQS